MNNKQKEYIEKNMDLIDNGDWGKVFSEAPPGLGGVLYEAGIDFMSELGYVPYGAFWDCDNLSGDLIIPDDVTTIGNGAFGYCEGFIGTLTIPDSVTTISNLAFIGCSGFTGDLIIPNNVKHIGESAFTGCSGFTGNLVIGKSVTTIGDSAFRRCDGFTTVNIPQSVTAIGLSAFESMGNITINYSGTKEQWKTLVTGKDIFKGTTYVCNCADGVLKKSR